MNDFDGLVAVVTGGASGIGAATASLLLSRGARVAVLDRDTEGAPDGTTAIRCDITDSDAVDAALRTVSATFGALDVLASIRGWVARCSAGLDVDVPSGVGESGVSRS